MASWYCPPKGRPQLHPVSSPSVRSGVKQTSSEFTLAGSWVPLPCCRCESHHSIRTHHALACPQDGGESMAARYRNRTEAGRRLAGELRGYAGRSDVIVLGLPRGGVPVAYEIARALQAPLDVFIVRKLGLPSHPELAMGAIASGGVRVIDRAAMGQFGVTDEDLAAVAA